jgi:hypothetical protein
MMTLSKLPFKLTDDTKLVNCTQHSVDRSDRTWKLERSLEVVKDEFGEDTKPVVMLQQHQLGSILDRPKPLYDTG